LVQGTYRPTWVEWAITIALFAGLFLLYSMFTRFFPIIPLWETAESLEGGEKPSVKRRQRIFGRRTRSTLRKEHEHAN